MGEDDEEKGISMASIIWLSALPMLAFAGLRIYLGVGVDFDGLMRELNILCTGFMQVLVGGSPAAAALSSHPPDLNRDAGIFCVFMVLQFQINWGVRLLIVEPFAKKYLGLRKAKLQKYAQSVMEAIFYGSFALIGLRIVPSQEWVWPSMLWWKGWSEGGHEILRVDLRCYYMLYLSRYVQQFISVLLERKRKDFVEMIVHHLVTVGLVYISYIYGWNRVGVVTMLLFDPADVPLHLAKICKYTGEATGRRFWQFLADRLFETFALVFFITRIALYSYVWWSAQFESQSFFPHGLPEKTSVSLLFVLLILQLYWFFLVLKVAVKLLRGGSAEDPRSDDEDEGDKKDKKDKKPESKKKQ